MTDTERELLLKLAKLATQGMGMGAREIDNLADRVRKDVEIKAITDSLVEE